MTGQELKTLREKLGISQAKMGEKLGVCTSQICKMEKGVNAIKGPVKIIALGLATQMIS